MKGHASHEHRRHPGQHTSGPHGQGSGRLVYEHGSQRADAEFEFIDLIDQGLPLLDEPKPPMMGQYSKDHRKAWAETIARFDSYIFVTAEYGRCREVTLDHDWVFREFTACSHDDRRLEVHRSSDGTWRVN
ncbi:NAD(P)H-dependent oxidoreductase [Arthrobacter sp. ISL-48]|uniref:NAD(P)H-dependent oxidoreductase n=1 Tax=Arthrobacter sp. ISL-48 TaxID=2819110 RepID=UPI001BEBE8B0|nr:NAD(P)H-dependent oxidoreductase [Arthrobacter sp. ISL-48]MBT2533239.1 NAD(P)H-dependent oxidoreductase [Arthrobacter sp. ISL-48]